MEHILKRSQIIPRPRAEVFEFFSDAGNLQRITPPELNFEILTPLPIEMKTGALIDYQLKLHGVPMGWKTEITQWNPPHNFVDTALKSPYKQWIHLHTFRDGEARDGEARDGETGITVMDDCVRYRLPFEPLGEVAHFLVRKQVEAIFDYRCKIIAEIFAVSS